MPSRDNCKHVKYSIHRLVLNTNRYYLVGSVPHVYIFDCSGVFIKEWSVSHSIEQICPTQPSEF